MAAINLRTSAWRIGEQRRVMTVLAAVGAIVVLAIAIVLLKGEFNSLVHAFDRIPAPFRHELYQASGGHVVANVTHHFTHR